MHILGRSGRFSLAACIVLTMTAASPLAAQGTPGDTDNDDELTITDAIRLLGWLSSHQGEEICLHAADVTGDGAVDISDVIFIMNFLFNGGEEPRPSSLDPADCYGENSALRFSLLAATALSPVSAVVEWETPLATTGYVQYGIYPWFLVESAFTATETRKHRTVLAALEPGTKHYFQVIAETSGGERLESPVAEFTTPADAQLAIRPDHPRLLVNAEELVGVHRRLVMDPYVTQRFESLLRWSTSLAGAADAGFFADIHFPLYVRALAFTGLLSGDPRLRERAVGLALEVARGALIDRTRDAVEAMAYVYDWLHDDLDAATREILAREIVRGCAALESATRDDEFVVGAHSIRNERAIVFGAVAVHGDDPEADRLLQAAAKRFQYGYLPALRYFAARDGGHISGWWYSAYDLQWTLSALAAWTSATNENWIAREAPWLQRMVAWFAHGLRGDETLIRLGDSRVFSGLVWQHRLLGLLLAFHAGSSHGMWLAERVHETEELWTAYALFDVLWHDSSLPAEHPGGPTKQLFDNAGVAVFRSSWESDATIATLRSEHVYALGHTHRDDCSFTLYHRGDLALDSGIYDEFGAEHHRNYYSRTIAHNTLTIHDPGEKFALFGVDYANDGGQRWRRTGSDVPTAWPATIEAALAPENGFVAAGMAAFEFAEDLSYARADGTRSYDPGKLSKFHRHFVWLDGIEGWNRPAIIILDDVIAARAELRKAYVLHTQNYPEIDGSVVVAAEGNGVLYHQTVFPRLAAFEVIGGPGSEFWVDGRNYAPSVSPRQNEIPGNWRVEILPPVRQEADIFVHALFPGDAGGAPPPLATPLITGSLIGVRLADWTVLFATNGPVPAVTYYNMRPESRHVILGLEPMALFEIALPGETASIRTSEAGTLRYFAQYAGWISVRRRAS